MVHRPNTDRTTTPPRGEKTMEEKLLDRKILIYNQETQRLKQLESELTKLIADTDNEELQEKFIDWINQRTRCNEKYVDALSVIADK